MAGRSPVEDILRKLAALRRRIRAALAAEGAARVLGALLGCVAASFCLDYVFKLEAAARAVLLAAGVGLLVWLVRRFLVRPLRRRTPDDALAVAFEVRHPELGDRVINALQLARTESPERYGMSPQLVDEAVRAASGVIDGLDERHLIDRRRRTRNVLAAAGAVAVLGAAAVLFPRPAGLWFQRTVRLG
ncbi:MAG: hypothetical protein ACE5JG_12505, partial [Planctomycetota bacterium]